MRFYEVENFDHSEYAEEPEYQALLKAINDAKDGLGLTITDILMVSTTTCMTDLCEVCGQAKAAERRVHSGWYQPYAVEMHHDDEGRERGGTGYYACFKHERSWQKRWDHVNWFLVSGTEQDDEEWTMDVPVTGTAA